MEIFDVAATNNNRKENRLGAKYPDTDDPRFQDGMIFPALKPGFAIRPGNKVFTIGSCFARNIERQLSGYNVPTLGYAPIDGDPLSSRGNTIFNEYNPGTIAQRINEAILGTDSPDRGILQEGDGYCDYFITGSTPAAHEIVLERRKRMAAIYSELVTSDLLVITLGMTEAWFDRERNVYLNRAPGAEAIRDPSGKGVRFELRLLDARDCLDLLEPAIETAIDSGLDKILLTVSPVPLQRTFGTTDATIANSTSKATLRSVAHTITTNFKQVDYFPSYEMVSLFAGNPYIQDNVHVEPELVARVTQYMRDIYEAQ